MSGGFRIERDSLGEVQVPEGALYGAQTQRASENFPISGQRFPRRFIQALGLVKKSAALTNGEQGQLEQALSQAIADAAGEVVEGRWDDEFVLDIYQTGSGTSTNMNANEVIARRAVQMLEGQGLQVHPNDHVNLGQSSNDVIPTAMYIAARRALEEDLLPALRRLEEALREKAGAFDNVLKSGRTHLMDATPVRLGQEFGGWARQVELGIRRVRGASEELAELALGGTDPTDQRFHGLGFSRGGRPFRGSGRQRRGGGGFRVLEHGGNQPHEDRRRYPMAGQRAYFRPP